MQRYFTNQKVDNFLILNSDDSYHIKKVMRMEINDNIEIVYDNKCYICEITELTNDVKAKILTETIENPELDIKVTIVQALVKEQKMDFIIQKTTELGVDSIIPISTTRSVVKANGKEIKKLERWQKICKEAIEQSKRVVVPEVRSIMDIPSLSKLDNYDVKLLCTVNENSKNIKKVLSNIKTGVTMLMVVGPEGGFTQQEEQILIDNGFIAVSLGSSVLRTETASLFLMSVIRYHDMR